MEPPAVTLNTPLTPVGSASPTTVVGAARGGARGGRGNRGRGDPVRRAHGRGVGRGRGASNKPSPQSKLPRYGFHCTLENHKQPVTSLKFSPDGLWLASASADKTIAIWNTETWIRAQVLTGHSKGTPAGNVTRLFSTIIGESGVCFPKCGTSILHSSKTSVDEL
eukprot:TRINITY_DN2919_c0_g2_i3.p2 TRINITY_DN2919_c0_g2~~TRINITY_DN2919_c0_g2_i3.p2  ORF type:complete len:179 (+),score=21.73 TRINITY_DN2919_c0_g2_i3:43-537(+)